jgi:hypothetical protein
LIGPIGGGGGGGGGGEGKRNSVMGIMGAFIGGNSGEGGAQRNEVSLRLRSARLATLRIGMTERGTRTMS